MIPHGRTAVDRSGIARLYGLAPGTVTNSMPYAAADFPDRLNPHMRRNWIWDEEQVRAYRDGRRGADIPALPTEPHPDDLLDDIEAAEYAGVSASMWRAYASDGTTGATSVVVCGRLRYWLRHTIQRRHAAPPGRGRTKGAVDRQPRRRRPSTSSS